MHMTNLFIGLFSSHLLLRPYSTSIGKLGYGIHSIEPSFLSEDRTINPEAIVCSERQRHTLLTEWTSSNTLSYEKREQILRYLRVSENDLKENAKVKSEACSSHSVWLTVPPSSLQSFGEIIKYTNSRLLLCSFARSPAGEYCVSFSAGSVLDNKLQAILNQTMQFRRVPEGYITIPLENLRDTRFSDGVIQQVVTFLVRENSQFTVEDICKSMIGIWISLSGIKKKSITRAVKRVMKGLSQQSCCDGWLVYERPYWKTHNFSKAKLKKFLKAVETDSIGEEESEADEEYKLPEDLSEEELETICQQIDLDFDTKL